MSHIALNAPAKQRITEFRLLGPDILIQDGRSIHLSFGGPRELLALLLLAPDHRINERQFRDSVRTRRPHMALLSAATAIRDALGDTGISIEVIGNRYKSGEELACRLDGEPLLIDLEECGTHIVAALEAVDGTEVMDKLAEVCKILERSPLAGLNSPYFFKWHRYITEARFDILELASSMVHLDSQAAHRPMFDQIKNDPGLRFEKVTHSRHADATPQSSHRSMHDLKLSFLKALESNPVSRIWRLPLSDPGQATERLLEIAAASTEGLDPDRVASATRWMSVQGRKLRLLRQSQDTSAIAVSIFLGDGQQNAAVEEALGRLLTEVNLEPYGQEKPIVGSWYRKLWARTRQETSHLSTAQIAAEIERKVRIEVFDRAQAVIDNQQATGAAALIAALQGEERACIRVGSTLVIKVDGLVLVNNLTQIQLAWLERNQMLLRDPEALLKGLEALPDPMRDLIELSHENASPGAL